MSNLLDKKIIATLIGDATIQSLLGTDGLSRVPVYMAAGRWPEYTPSIVIVPMPGRSRGDFDAAEGFKRVIVQVSRERTSGGPAPVDLTYQIWSRFDALLNEQDLDDAGLGLACYLFIREGGAGSAELRAKPDDPDTLISERLYRWVANDDRVWKQNMTPMAGV